MVYGICCTINMTVNLQVGYADEQPSQGRTVHQFVSELAWPNAGIQRDDVTM